MSHSAEEVKKHVRTYVAVFAALAVLTVVTVAVSYLHLPTAQAVTVALFVACIKGALVAAFFMHLISEKKLVTSILILTAFFLVTLLILPQIQ